MSVAGTVHNPTFTFNPTTCKLRIEAEAGSEPAKIDYYMIGEFNHWTTADASAKFTDNGDGTYTWTYTGDFEGVFKINDGSWAHGEANFGGPTKMEAGQKYDVTANKDSGNMSLAGVVKNPVFTFNPKSLQISYEGEKKEVEYTYTLTGKFKEDTAWQAIGMTKGADGNWTANVTTTNPSTNIAFHILQLVVGNTTPNDYIKGQNGKSQVVLGTSMTCASNGEDFYIAPGTYTFNYNPTANTLTVTGTPSTTEPVQTTYKYYLRGTIFGTQQWEDKLMEDKGGVLSVGGCLTNGEFGISKRNGDKQEAWYSSAGDGNINAEGEYACKVNGTNFKNTLTGWYVISFDPATPMLTVKAANQFRYKLWGQFAGKTWSRVDMNLDWDKYEKGQEYWYAEGVNVVGENGNAAFGIQKAEWETGTQVQWISHNGSGTVAVGNNYDCKPQGTDFKIPAGQYTFVYDPNENKLYVNAYDNTVTSITDILGSDAPAEYYNLQGVRVDQPESGVYIMRKGNKTFKVIK